MAVNKVILVGNVGKDPEVRYLDNDVAVANFSLATTERAFTTRTGQEIPERTEWHNIVAWRHLAKLSENHIRKGMKLYIEGKIRTRSWEDQNGAKRYVTEIFADEIELPKREGDGQWQDTTASPIVKDTPPTSIPEEPISNMIEDDLPF